MRERFKWDRNNGYPSYIRVRARLTYPALRAVSNHALKAATGRQRPGPT